jgi:tetratricopeptide (TPR) repeat protein
MRITPILFAILLAAFPLCAQRHKLTINAETPEGQLLQQIGQEGDAAKKTALMEEFTQKYAKHEGMGWVLEQLVAAYLKDGQFDKVLDTGGKLLAMDPADVATAHSCLKAAEGKKDPTLIKEWAAKTSELAKKVAAAPKPADEDEEESWKANVDYAKQVDAYTEYSLYAAALATQDPNHKIMLYEALEARNPEGQYIAPLNLPYFFALRQTNQNDKAIALAEKVLQKDQSSEDMLLAVADHHFNKKGDPARIIELSSKLVEVMGSKPKPEGIADADWEKRKNLMTGLGHWMIGITYGNQSKWKETDAALRQALPLVSDNDQLKAQTLFYLALSNYKMGEPRKDKKLIAEALRFNVQCAAIKSPFQGQASKNASVIRQQYGLT